MATNFICDVCALRFKPQPDPEHPEFAECCPRCHTPFIHPASTSPARRRYGLKADETPSHNMTCG